MSSIMGGVVHCVYGFTSPRYFVLRAVSMYHCLFITDTPRCFVTRFDNYIFLSVKLVSYTQIFSPLGLFMFAFFVFY